MEAIRGDLPLPCSPDAQLLRDTIRVRALERHYNVITISLLQSRSSKLTEWERHIPYNYASPSLPPALVQLFSNLSCSYIIFDYVRTPGRWLAESMGKDQWSPALKGLQTLLSPQGSILLPANASIISELNVKKVPTNKNLLFRTTGQVEALLPPKYHNSVQ